MSAVTKDRASPAFIAQMKALEDQSDECYRPLKILSYPQALATWMGMVGTTKELEAKLTNEPKAFRTAMLNLSRTASLLARWSRKASADPISLKKLYWRSSFEAYAREAIDVGFNYLSFVTCFTSWHNSFYAAELVAPNRIRFEVMDFGPSERRVSAFHKGMRPGMAAIDPGGENLPAEAKRIQDKVIQQCRRSSSDPFAFSYRDARPAQQAVLPVYKDRLAKMFRRDDAINLGNYTLAEFKEFYAALCAVCSVHEHTCYRLGLSGKYPFSSCLLLYTKSAWIDLLTPLTSLEADSIARMVRDLTLPISSELSWLDPHVCPFVPLVKGSDELLVIPHLPLNSRADENILRICSYVNPRFFDTASTLKPQELYREMRSILPGRFTMHGSVSLPEPLPDIDLVLIDEQSSTLLCAEMKWLRKPFFVGERLRQDDEFRKGIEQIKAIRQFLQENPAALVERRITRVPITEFRLVYYAVIARDHFFWNDPAVVPVFDYGIFRDTIKNATDLDSVIAAMAGFDWLPRENADFTVRDVEYSANGVAIEYATIFPVGV